MTQPPQVQCPNCKGFKTERDSKKYNMFKLGGAMIFVGAVSLVFISILGFVLVPLGFIVAIYANVMKEDGSMECKTCKFKFKTEITNVEPKRTTPWWKLEQ